MTTQTTQGFDSSTLSRHDNETSNGADYLEGEDATTVYNPIYDSSSNVLQYMGEVDQRRIQLHNQLDGTQTVHAIARVDFDDHSDQSGLSFKVGDRILVTGMNTNGTWKGRIGEKSGNFFASHVDFFEGNNLRFSIKWDE